MNTDSKHKNGMTFLPLSKKEDDDDDDDDLKAFIANRRPLWNKLMHFKELSKAIEECYVARARSASSHIITQECTDRCTNSRMGPSVHDAITAKPFIDATMDRNQVSSSYSLFRASFPWKLHKILDDAAQFGQEHIISWLPSGTAFRVNNPWHFVESVMPIYFKSQTKKHKYKSFLRQLHIYGFKRITKGSEKGAYTHSLLIRGHPEVCCRMVRTKVKNNHTHNKKDDDRRRRIIHDDIAENKNDMQHRHNRPIIAISGDSYKTIWSDHNNDLKSDDCMTCSYSCESCYEMCSNNKLCHMEKVTTTTTKSCINQEAQYGHDDCDDGISSEDAISTQSRKWWEDDVSLVRSLFYDYSTLRL